MSQTARRRSTEGYTLLEMLVVMLVMAVLARTAYSLRAMTSMDYHLFPSRLVLTQSRSLVSGIPQEMEEQDAEIRFNGNAGINKARTLTFPEAGNRKIVLELGTGTFDERE
ncbi:MAG: type II secretion system protein [Bulleidia sp.]|nr:type II secretion system protein [Bulleidia sp.]